MFQPFVTVSRGHVRRTGTIGLSRCLTTFQHSLSQKIGNCFGNTVLNQTIQQHNHHNDVPANLSPYYANLPTGAKQRTVKSITDGDTLKLENGEKNGERNRLVGIDTPEMRPAVRTAGICKGGHRIFRIALSQVEYDCLSKFW